MRILDRLENNEVDLPAEDGLEIFIQAEEVIRIFARRQGLEFHQEIDVTGIIELPACGRTEQFQAMDMMPAAESFDTGAVIIE